MYCEGTPIREESMTRAFKNFFLHLWGTLWHKFYVMGYIVQFCIRLIWRGVVHDFSKLLPSEFDGFIKTIHRLKGSEYGSDEYKELLAIIKPSLDHHYGKYRHHPEHFGDKAFDLGGMGLLDLVEMFLDWRAATLRHKTGSVGRSLAINEDRFKIPMGVANILYNDMSPKDRGVYKKHYMDNMGKIHHWGPPCAQGPWGRTGPMAIESESEKSSTPNQYRKLWESGRKCDP